jgi:hypothetical protein
MKCIKQADGKVERLTEVAAAEAVKHGAKYCPKSVWKASKK